MIFNTIFTMEKDIHDYFWTRYSRLFFEHDDHD